MKTEDGKIILLSAFSVNYSFHIYVDMYPKGCYLVHMKSKYKQIKVKEDLHAELKSLSEKFGISIPAVIAIAIHPEIKKIENDRGTHESCMASTCTD